MRDWSLGHLGDAALVRDLKALNDATWKGGGADFRAWRAAGLPGDLALEPSARFAFAIFLGLGNRSLKHGLPMVLAR